MVKKEKTVAQEAPKKEEKTVTPVKPCEKQRDEEIAVLTKEIEALRAKQNELKSEIDIAQSGKEEYSEERNGMWEKLKAIDAERKVHKEVKESLLESLKKTKESNKNLKTLEKDAQNWNEEKLIDTINKIERQMTTGTFSLKQEKDMMSEIKKLKAKRPEAARKAAEFAASKASAEAAAPVDGADLKTRLDEVKALMLTLNEAHNAQYEEIKAHADVRTAKMDGSKELIATKTQLRDEIFAVKGKIDEIWTAYKSASKAFNEWEKQVRKERQAKQQAAWEADQAVWAAKDAERELEQPSPFLEDIIKLDQALEFCQGLVPKEKVEEVAAEKKEFAQLVEGATILCKKSDRNTQMTVAPKKKAALRKKGGDKVKSTSIKHTSETIQTFEAVKIAAPMTTAELPAAVEVLSEKLAELRAKTSAWEEERKAKIEKAKANVATEEVAVATEEPASV